MSFLVGRRASRQTGSRPTAKDERAIYAAIHPHFRGRPRSRAGLAGTGSTKAADGLFRTSTPALLFSDSPPRRPFGSILTKGCALYSQPFRQLKRRFQARLPQALFIIPNYTAIGSFFLLMVYLIRELLCCGRQIGKAAEICQ